MTLSDAQGILLEVNPAYCRLVGYNRSQVLGKRFAFIVPKEKQNQVIEQYNNFFDSKTIPSSLEMVIRRQDNMERRIESRSSFISLKNHRTALLSVIRDLTARQYAEDELKHQLRGLTSLNAIANVIIHSPNLQNLLEEALDIALNLTTLKIGAIHLLSEDDNVPHLAAQRGFSIEQEQDRTVQAYFAQVASHWHRDTVVEDRPDKLSLSFPSKSPHTFVGIPIRTKSKWLGELILVGAGLHPVGETDKVLLATIGYQLGGAIENIRLAEKAAEIKTLRELDRLRSELIANVSHELRTPLGLIKVFCTTLMAKDIAFDRITRLEFLNDIDQEADKLEKIVSNLLDLSRLQNNRLHLDKHALDLGELITSVVEDMKVHLAQHSVVCDLAAEPLSVLADPHRLEQVLRNLITNAVKYSPNRGTITLQCRKEARQIIVMVNDEGIGIPNQDLERIFERFYRVDNEITRQASGVGLGLAVSRGIIEEHGGRIWAESVLGKGSSFYFTLPEADAK